MLTKLILTAVVALAFGTVAINSAAEAAYIPRISIPVTRPNVPMQFNRVNFSNPASVRQFVSQPQPTTTSSGRYLPWMVKNPYGIQGASKNMAGRAVLGCGC
jgi:hypothetical protein